MIFAGDLQPAEGPPINVGQIAPRHLILLKLKCLFILDVIFDTETRYLELQDPVFD